METITTMDLYKALAASEMKWKEAKYNGTPEEREAASFELEESKREITRRDNTGQITWAWAHLVRLCGTNIKVPVLKKTAKKVFILKPIRNVGDFETFSLNRADFEAGKAQYRDGWGIEPWGERAERTSESEKHWMD